MARSGKNDVRFADDQFFATARNDTNVADNAAKNMDRTGNMATLRASAAVKAKGGANANASNFQGFPIKPNNEKQADLM